MTEYKTKDSGHRQDYSSGMRRDIQTGKPDFYLCLTEQPYSEMMLTRWAIIQKFLKFFINRIS